MNLKIIKNRFSTFLQQFQHEDIKLVMQFLELIVAEYNDNPNMILGNFNFTFYFIQLFY
jgi:hypothetical protein